jgi:hypothetical protein
MSNWVDVVVVVVVAGDIVSIRFFKIVLDKQPK